MDGTRAAEVLPLLQERLAILPGGRDRRGGPVLLFPSTPRRERAKPEDYRRLLQYLFAIPSDEARGLRFTVIVDMRGTTWDSVKPILKVTLLSKRAVCPEILSGLPPASMPIVELYVYLDHDINTVICYR